MQNQLDLSRKGPKKEQKPMGFGIVDHHAAVLDIRDHDIITFYIQNEASNLKRHGLEMAIRTHPGCLSDTQTVWLLQLNLQSTYGLTFPFCLFPFPFLFPLSLPFPFSLPCFLFASLPFFPSLPLPYLCMFL